MQGVAGLGERVGSKGDEPWERRNAPCQEKWRSARLAARWDCGVFVGERLDFRKERSAARWRLELVVSP